MQMTLTLTRVTFEQAYSNMDFDIDITESQRQFGLELLDCASHRLQVKSVSWGVRHN